MPSPSDHDLLPHVEQRRERIMARVAKAQDCWLWLGAHDTNGYGQIAVNSHRTMRAHRAVWMLHRGRTVPEGMTLDHLCRNRRCVNPRHMEVVTIEENIRRGAVAREGGATIRERVTAKGVVRFAVLFRDEVDGETRQRSRTFGTREDAEAFRQEFIDRRFTALPTSVWDKATA